MESDNPTQGKNESEHGKDKPEQKTSTPEPHIAYTSSESHSSPPPTCCESSCKAHKEKRDWHDHVTLWMEIIGVIFLIAYTTVAAFQWYEMKKSTEAANRNFRRDERSWMAFKFMEGNITFTMNKSFLVPTEIMNTGKTPAKNVRGNIVIGVFKKGERLDFTYTPGHANYAITAGTIFPTGKIVESFEAIKHGQERAEAIIFTGLLKDELVSGQSLLVVHGRIVYNDIFGTEHWTTYCRYVLHPELISEECTRYNDTDDSD